MDLGMALGKEEAEHCIPALPDLHVRISCGLARRTISP
jgi:hypothetical protein